MMSTPNFKIFAGSNGEAFAKRMCAYMGVPLSQSTVIRFSEGNTMVRADETVREFDVYIVQSIGMDPNNEFVELLFWMDAFKRASAKSVTAIMPYFAYAKGDKKDEPRVSIRARVCAECLELAGADRVITMDLHSGQVQGFFKKPVDHLHAMPLLCDTVKPVLAQYGGDWVVVSPDAGFTKQARRIGQYLGLPVAIADKTRKGHDENAEILEVIGEIAGRNALVVDDFSITCGTLASLAEALKARGVGHVVGSITHNVLSEAGVKRLMDSSMELLIATDTLDNPFSALCPKVKRVSVAPLFAEVLVRMHKHEGISTLYERIPARVFEYSGGGNAL